MTYTCLHCKQPYIARCGRGLCRACWDDKEVRAKYPPLAPFGGKAASEMWKAQKQERARQRITEGG